MFSSITNYIFVGYFKGIGNIILFPWYIYADSSVKRLLVLPKIFIKFFFIICIHVIFFFFFLQDEIGLKEWLTSLKSTYKNSLELLASMAKKAGKIYGTETNNRNNMVTRNTNGN